ncbi:hypothetical protein Tco_1391286 [Tanacetum coccineum]
MEVNPPKSKKQKDTVPRRSRTITFANNVLPDPDEAFDSAIVEKRQSRESKKQSILEEIKRKAPGEGSGGAPESLDHSNSSESANDDKTKSEKQTRTKPQLQSPNVTTTLAEDFTRYLNDPNEVQISELVNEPLYTEATTLTVNPVLKMQEHPAENVTTTPPANPPTRTKKKRTKTLLRKAIEKKNDWKKAVMQRLTNLEQGNHAEAIEELVQVNVINKVNNQLLKFLPKAFSNYVKPRLERTVLDRSRSFLAHDKHLELDNTLINSMDVDESAAKDREGEKNRKRRRKDAGGSSSKKSKAQDEYSHYERGDDAIEPRHEEEIEHEVQSELVDAEEEPKENELINGYVVIFGKCVKKFHNKDKITKEDLKGQAFELLKGIFKNSVELEYNMEQCYLALTDKIDLTNPKGDRFHYDVSKLLPLVGPPGRKKILISYFFNHDLEYLKYGNEEKRYALSVTKIKAARYENEGIEEMITYQ